MYRSVCNCHLIQGQNKTVYLGLGDMAKNVITIKLFLSVDIDNYHDKCQITISFKFKV